MGMPLATVLGWVLAAAALMYVGWPLFQSGSDDPGEEPELPGPSPLEKQKLEAYAALKEAELDRRMGKLSDEDFTALTQRYRRQALAAIAALEQAHERDAQRRPESRPAFCPRCGKRAAGGAKYCGSCGRALADLSA